MVYSERISGKEVSTVMELVRIFFDEFKDQEEKISNNHKDLIDNITWNDLSMDDVFADGVAHGGEFLLVFGHNIILKIAFV